MHLKHFTVIALAAVILESCKNAPPASQPTSVNTPVVLQLGDVSFSTEEFKESYEKNKQSATSDSNLTAREYLDLYTNMKLKVLASIESGNDTTSDFKDEIATYRDVLSKGYLTDKGLVEHYTKEAYERMREEIHAAHILIAVPEFASPEDTTSAYQASLALLQRLKEGADFSEMAFNYSKDPTAKQNKGDLGNFTAFQMLYPLENAAYNTPVGKLAGPIRTTHGYHLLKVLDRKPNRGRIQVAHLLVRTMPGATASESKKAEDKITKAYMALHNGIEWNKVVSEYSEDKQSANNGGLLQPFTIGTMVKPFEDAAFALQNPGEYSKPIKTDFGWHIIRLTQRFPLESYDNVENTIQQKVMTDTRGKRIEAAQVQKIAAKYPIEINNEGQALLLSKVDSSFIKGNWSFHKAATQEERNATLLKIANSNYSVQTFLDFLAMRQRALPSGSVPTNALKKYIIDFKDSQVIRYERDHLEENNKEFKQLMSEIRDGVLLSKMMERNVWEKSIIDTTQQRALYEANKSKYTYPERAVGFIIESEDQKLIDRANAMLASYPYQMETQGKPVLFTNNSPALSDDAKASLNDVVSVMLANPTYELEVNSYQHSSESAGLSSLRLQEVVRYIVAKGIDIKRIVEKNHNALRVFETPAEARRVNLIFYSQQAQDVARVLSRTKGNTISIRDGYFTKEDPSLKGLNWAVGSQKRVENNKIKLVRIDKIEEPRLKTFQEARGAVINEYQRILENNWLNTLKNQYPVKVNEEELKKIDN